MNKRKVFAIAAPACAIGGALTAWTLDSSDGPLAFVIIIIGLAVLMIGAAMELKP